MPDEIRLKVAEEPPIHLRAGAEPGGVNVSMEQLRVVRAVSPTIDVERVDGGAEITVEDYRGDPQTAQLYDGHSPVITASKSDDVTTVYADGVPIATINDGQSAAAGRDGKDGKDGVDGKDGKDGQDGHTPVITASKSGDITTVYVDGVAIATLTDGEDGQDGHTPEITASKTEGVTTIYADGESIATINDGADGHTPSITASKVNTVTTVYVDGVAVATVTDGTNGTNGDDGISPTVSISSITGGHRVSVTDANGTRTFDVMDGSDGYTPVKGVDYFDGTNGTDGHSPSVTAGKSGTVTTIYVDGTAVATINDGTDGAPGTPGTPGAPGTPGEPGEGVPTGGTTGQILAKSSGTDYSTEWIDAPESGTKMVVLSYGASTWNDFITAYRSNAVVYCRASSNSNPGTGTQTRMAFMAYVNNAETPTEVEFQYYRSVSSHSATQQGDQVYVYKLTSAGAWSVTTRETYTKIVTGQNIWSSYSNGTITLSAVSPSADYLYVEYDDNEQSWFVSDATIDDIGALAYFDKYIYLQNTTITGEDDLLASRYFHLDDYSEAIVDDIRMATVHFSRLIYENGVPTKIGVFTLVGEVYSFSMESVTVTYAETALGGGGSLPEWQGGSY